MEAAAGGKFAGAAEPTPAFDRHDPTDSRRISLDSAVFGSDHETSAIRVMSRHALLLFTVKCDLQ